MNVNRFVFVLVFAATVCEARQRDKLERLCRYITRPPNCHQALVGRWPGQRGVPLPASVPGRYDPHVVLESLDFIARLAALVPRPRLNLTRFHGVFAPHFKHRVLMVSCRPRGRVDSDKPRAPMTWMQRLKRVFAIDIETCPECGC